MQVAKAPGATVIATLRATPKNGRGSESLLSREQAEYMAMAFQSRSKGGNDILLSKYLRIILIY